LLWQWGKQVHSWNEVFELETQISDWKIRHADFVEGVRARLVDKDLSPAWKQGASNSLKIFSLVIHQQRALKAGMNSLNITM
jgi:hypothetical protein